MLYLNLSEGFNPYQAHQHDCISFESFTFNGGEPHIKIGEIPTDDPIIITQRLNSFNDLGLLCLAVDALRRVCFQKEFKLFIPYFLGARQDRVCNKGEAFTAKIVGDIINSLNFSEVSVLDPHSDVVGAVVNNCKIITNHDFVKNCLFSIAKRQDYSTNDLCLISPDAGSNKKMKDLMIFFSEQFEQPIFENAYLIKCDKTRDVSTGEITGFEVYAEDLKGKDCVIVDDICDGGGTFMGLAEELKAKNAGDLFLIVTHGIFSRGVEGLLKHFKAIYLTDSIKDITEYDFKDTEHRVPQIKIVL